MDIKARMPLLVRGHPNRNKGMRDVFVSQDVEWTLPEVSLSEMPVAFRSSSSFERRGTERFRFGGPIEDFRFVEIPSDFQLRQMDGHLYRKVGSADQDIRRMFRYAFPTGKERYHGNTGSEISFKQEEPDLGNPCPVSLPVYRQLMWQRRCLHIEDGDGQHVWPNSIPCPPGEENFSMDGSRNFVTFEDVLNKLPHYDHLQYERCLEMYPHHLERFVLADGELWVRTPPPVYNVQPYYETQKTSVVVSMELAPDYHRTSMSIMNFPLHLRDEAIDYAQHLLMTEGEKKELAGNLYDLSVDYDISTDDTAMAYDHREEELRRVSCAMSMEAHRFISRNPEWAEKRLTASAIDMVRESFTQVRATNYVIGEFGDASHWLANNAEVWKKSGRRGSVYSFGRTKSGTDHMLDRAMRIEADRTIDLGDILKHTFTMERR